MQPELATGLPKLPTMFFRSLFTVARKDHQTADSQEMLRHFTAPAFSGEYLHRFHAAFGDFVEEVPLPVLYCLAQRAHLAQMLEPEFPWPAPGLVHVSNELEQLCAIDPQRGFVLHAKVILPARGPKVSARRLRPVFAVDFFQGDVKVAHCRSEYQVMPKTRNKPSKAREKKVYDSPSEDWESFKSWRISMNTARNYARLSGDFNPIHLHPLLSRLFGFQQPIIHGMYMVARAQAELERRAQRGINSIHVEFKRPVPLPARIQLWQHTGLDKTNSGAYQICGAEDNLLRLEGSFSFRE